MVSKESTSKNKALHRCNAVISDPNAETRLRLKQAAAAAPFFGDVYQLANPKDLSRFLNEDTEIDIIFLSGRLGRIELDNYVREAKCTKQGAAAAYIMVLDHGKADTSTVAKELIQGIDGFLFEPYSVDSLVEIAEIAEKVRGERSLAREKAAMKFVLEECVSYIDAIAFLKTTGKPPGKNLVELKRLGKTIASFPENLIEDYKEILCDVFMKVGIPIKSHLYSGASERVRKKAEEKLAEKVQHGPGEQPEEAPQPETKPKKPQIRIIKKSGF